MFFCKGLVICVCDSYCAQSTRSLLEAECPISCGNTCSSPQWCMGTVKPHQAQALSGYWTFRSLAPRGLLCSLHAGRGCPNASCPLPLKPAPVSHSAGFPAVPSHSRMTPYRKNEPVTTWACSCSGEGQEEVIHASK